MAIKAATRASPAEMAVGASPKWTSLKCVWPCRRAPYDQFFLPELQRHQQEQGEAPEEGQQPGTLRPTTCASAQHLLCTGTETTLSCDGVQHVCIFGPALDVCRDSNSILSSFQRHIQHACITKIVVQGAAVRLAGGRIPGPLPGGFPGEPHRRPGRLGVPAGHAAGHPPEPAHPQRRRLAGSGTQSVSRRLETLTLQTRCMTPLQPHGLGLI
jgi:hypothetical protein